MIEPTTELTIIESLLSDLETKARAATPGPWTQDEDERACLRDADGEELAFWDSAVNLMVQDFANCTYAVAVSPERVLALVAEVRRLQALVNVGCECERLLRQAEEGDEPNG